MGTGPGIGIPVLFPGKGAVTAPDEVIKIFAKFDVVGDIMDALGTAGTVHRCTSFGRASIRFLTNLCRAGS